MSKISRTVMAGLLIALIGGTVAAVAAYSYYLSISSDAVGPASGPISIYVGGTKRENLTATPIHWGSFYSMDNKTNPICIMNNSTVPLTISVIASGLSSTWRMGCNLTGKQVPAKGKINGTIWLYACGNATGPVAFSTEIRVHE